MNKTLNINIGGYPFTIDDLAFERLEEYLSALRRHFRNSEGCEEIIGDIEARIAELFQAHLENRKIIEDEDVHHAINVMGTPDDFDMRDMEEENQFRSKSDSTFQMNTGKKLYRDTDNEVIGGVCSGLAAYFGIQDPIWVRIGFLLVFFTMGFGLLLYLIMWAIVPEAKTAGDRLAMMGEPINVNSIASEIENHFENLSDKIHEIGNEIRSKKKGSRPKDPSEGDDGGTYEAGVSVLNPEARKGFDAVKKIFRILFIIVGASLLLGLLVAWIGVLAGSVAAMNFSEFIFPGTAPLTYLMVLPFLLLVAIPIFGFALRIIRLFNPARIKWGKKRFILPVLWGASWVGVFAVLSISGSQFQEETDYRSELSFVKPESNSLNVKMRTDKISGFGINTDWVNISPDQLDIKNIDIKVTKSEDAEWHLWKDISVRGKDLAIAKEQAMTLDYGYNQKDSELTIDDYFSIHKPNKWRAQNIILEIHVPDGGKITFDKKSLFKIDCQTFPKHELHKELLGKTFIMTDEGLIESVVTEGTQIGMNQ